MRNSTCRIVPSTLCCRGFNNLAQVVGLDGAQSGILTVGVPHTLPPGFALAEGTLTTSSAAGTSSHDGYALLVPTGVLVFHNTGSGDITPTNPPANGTGSSQIVVNPMEPPPGLGTITGGGTLVLGGGILGTNNTLSTGGVVHVNTGATLYMPSNVLLSQWTVHADGTISLAIGTNTLTFDSASAAAILPPRHSGPLTFMADVSLTLVESTLGLVPLDFSGTITLPAGMEAAEVTGLGALSGAVVV